MKPVSRAMPVSKVEPPLLAHTRIPKGVRTAVSCPDCAAEPGEKCLNSFGMQTNNIHAARKRIALREWHKRQEQQP